MRFADLSISESILAALHAEGYTEPTPIQAKAIPPALEGRDVWGCAQTGTGKTAAFAIPVLQRLAQNPLGKNATRRPRALVLSPTRELATQIADSFRTYGKGQGIYHTIICGGVSQHPQVQDMRRGVDIIVATPGRLKDLIEQRHVDLRDIEMLVLDEADRMLDMGFIHDIHYVCELIPKDRQTMLFSATMPSSIRKLANNLMTDPVTVEVASESTTADRIEEVIYPVNKRDKGALLSHLLETLPMYRTIVFTRTKHGADHVVTKLLRGNVSAVAIHGNKSQPARMRALRDFSSNRVAVLVATDIASRGIDVDGITHVVNYDVTHEPETYVHRIGRTARAGASGVAISFVDREERNNMRAIERLIRREINVLPSPVPPSQFASNRGDGYDPDRPRRAPGIGGNNQGNRGNSYGGNGGGNSYGGNGGGNGGGGNSQFNRRRKRRTPADHASAGAGAGSHN